MEQFEQNDKNSFMIEQIKERPINKKRLVRRTMITASMAVIFGLIACFTFLVLEPVLSNMLYPPEESVPVIIFPEDELEEEMQPEEMLSDNLQEEESQQQVNEEVKALEQQTEEIKEMINNTTLNLESYKQMNEALNNYVYGLSRYMTKVTVVSSDTDWISDATNESEHETCGVVVAETKNEIYILTDYSSIKNADRLIVSFYNDYSLEGEVHNVHIDSNLALISVNSNSIIRGALGEEPIVATFGTSKVRKLVGTPVVVLGCPIGDYGSMGVGMITSDGGSIVSTDANYQILATDVAGISDSTGVVFNLFGQVIGIVNRTSMDAKEGNEITAFGITELKYLVNAMSQKESVPYMGIKGIDVTGKASVEHDVPSGAYITEIDMESPAMLAGLQVGDVITVIDEYVITNYSDYFIALLRQNSGETIKVKAMRLVQDEYTEMEFEITIN